MMVTPPRQPRGTARTLLVSAGLILAASLAPRGIGAQETPAPAAPLATKGLLLDLSRAGERLVAVGANGVIITSDDEGNSWQQASVPAQALLTCVSFSDAKNGWAFGHGGMALCSVDGGRAWQRVAVPVGADASFLDTIALDEKHILAAGAYGLFLATNDGGATWEQRHVLTEDQHINRLTRGRSGALYLAGESGTLAHSNDAGATWKKIEAPYEGSFYGVHELASGRLLAHGLRGHAFISDDAGRTWTEIAIAQPVLLMTAVELAPGSIAIAGLGGHLFVSRDNASTFRAARPDALGGTAEILGTRDSQHACVVGDNGVHRIEVP